MPKATRFQTGHSPNSKALGMQVDAETSCGTTSKGRGPGEGDQGREQCLKGRKSTSLLNVTYSPATISPSHSHLLPLNLPGMAYPSWQHISLNAHTMKQHTATTGDVFKGNKARRQRGREASATPVRPPGMTMSNGVRYHLLDFSRQAEPLNWDTETPAAYSGHFLIRRVFVAARPCARAPAKGFTCIIPIKPPSHP